MRSSVLLLLSFVLPAAACGQSAPPEPWMVIYRGGELIGSVDTTRITRAGQGVQLWLRLDSTPAEVPGEPGKTFTRAESLQRIDCTAGRVNQERMRVFDAGGAMVAEYVEDTRWNTMSEHPLGDSVYRELCAWLSRRPSA